MSCSIKGKLCLFDLLVLPVRTQNQDSWNFYSSLTMNNGKLI